MDPLGQKKHVSSVNVNSSAEDSLDILRSQRESRRIDSEKKKDLREEALPQTGREELAQMVAQMRKRLFSHLTRSSNPSVESKGIT